MKTGENLAEKLFNKDVMSLDTYIMFKLKEKTEQLKPDLIKRNRAPISLSMGAPTAAPPKELLDKLKEVLDEDGIHLYSTPKGEVYFRKAIAERMKNRVFIREPFKRFKHHVFQTSGMKSVWFFGNH